MQYRALKILKASCKDVRGRGGERRTKKEGLEIVGLERGRDRDRRRERKRDRWRGREGEGEILKKKKVWSSRTNHWPHLTLMTWIKLGRKTDKKV